ncbi:hypothetical protein A9R11_31635 [Klebsiella pneumoniae]|nr:hypothetical protein A9R11_31635 [Klebsiella pneumoniae]
MDKRYELGGAGRLDFAAAGVHPGGADGPQRHGHRPWGIKDRGRQRRFAGPAQYALAKSYRGKLGGFGVSWCFSATAPPSI